MSPLNSFLFTAFPYLAFGVFVVGCIYRYKVTSFKYSSLSSQFLEGKKLFWGSISFHWGILAVFLLHLAAFLIPDTILAWNASSARLFLLEATGITFGIAVFFGLIVLYTRRVTNSRLRAVSNRMDFFLEVLLLVQVGLGIYIAVGHRWGSAWFASTLSPYLWSLVKLSPDATAVVAMPTVIKTHVFLAFFILFMVPFTRLVHFLVAPLHYIGRPYQQVIWYWNRKEIRDPRTAWSKFRPRNN
ncbi:MAG: respiratory nitrate reductase subunit gamma [Bdellovibrionaceae bacterium]|nr:respiratory nitrate reductase subunit gamma [Bdellovibrionales bacterium]MCB9083456.1 respiratory nitrate reductase subunit gamma [Pseudobdellovibrionaceae bacterium]